VGLVIYYQRGHKELRYLLVLPGSTTRVSTAEFVSLDRRRIRIERGFRDFKTHPGAGGLRLQVQISERVQRLLMAFTLAHALVVALGLTRVAEHVQDRVEDRRSARRHGTAKILSARTVAGLLFCGLCGELLAPLAATVAWLLAHAPRGVASISSPSPSESARLSRSGMLRPLTPRS